MFIIEEMRSVPILLLLIVHGAPIAASAFELTDFAEDDYGAGELIYPNRTDFRPGDLDLLSFSAENEADGTWFTARFRNDVRSPDGAVTVIGQVPMSRLARNDFYTFNIDIYIDQDLKPGSGRTESLPGRKVAIDPATAWEKTVLLTPRPSMARTLLVQYFERIEERALRAEQGRVGSEDNRQISASVDARLDNEYFMPERVRVRGREIKFFVPREFLGGPASADWAYTVLVTGAELEQTALLATATEDVNLMNLPAERGIKFHAFGLPGDADPEQPPVVDYLSPRVGWQESQLSEYNLARGHHARLVGLVPSGRIVDPEPRVVRETPPSAPPERLPAAGQAPAAEKKAALPVPTGTNLSDRLRAIRALRDQGVLTEAEYQEIRRRLVSEY